MTRKVGILIGSLRAQTLSRKLARELARLAPPSLELSIVEIGELPLYNADDEAEPPGAVTDFRQRAQALDAVLFVTPEYNRSVPAVLKNALDVGSRPHGQSVWGGLPAAVVSLSPGKMGGFGANHHLRQCLVYLDMPAMQQPEAYVAGADKLFDDQARIAHPETEHFLTDFLKRFARWADINARAMEQSA